MAIRIFRRLRELLDVNASSPADGDHLVYDDASGKWVNSAVSLGGAPTDADYLVGSAQGGLSAEIVVGTSPGGELSGTWASPTVDATHSGSSHASVQAAAEATAAAALASHVGAADPHTGYQKESEKGSAGGYASLDGSGLVPDAQIPSGIARDSEVSSAISTSESGQVRDGDAAGGVLSGTYPNPGFAADMATQAELDAVASAKQDVDSDLTAIAALSPANDDVLQRKAGAWTNRTIAQLLSDLNLGALYQPLDSDLTALAGLAIAADKLPYGNGSHTMALADFTAAARALLDDADASTMLSTLGVSTFIKTLLDDADEATARSTLGIIASLFQSGGAQAIKLDDLATPDDNTDLNASTSAHGLLKKLDNDTTHFLRGDGSWAVPPAAGTKLAYAEFTSNVTVSSGSASSPTDVVSSGAVTYAAADICVEFFAPIVECGNGDFINISLWDGSTQLGDFVDFALSGARDVPCMARRFLTPTAGSHTYKARAYRNATNGTIYAGDGAAGHYMPGYIRVTAAA